MSTLEIKQHIIDKLLTINSKELLLTLNKILETKTENVVSLTKEQKEMLQMSMEDIKNDAIISQTEIDNQDLKWLS